MNTGKGPGRTGRKALDLPWRAEGGKAAGAGRSEEVDDGGLIGAGGTRKKTSEVHGSWSIQRGGRAMGMAVESESTILRAVV